MTSRRITLDPVIEAEPLSVQPVRPESTMGCGFRIEWMSTDEDGLDASLAVGAGCGSPYLTMHAERDGVRVDEYIDMRKVFAAWIDAALARGANPPREEAS